jgi:hypothetical protein
MDRKAPLGVAIWVIFRQPEDRSPVRGEMAIISPLTGLRGRSSPFTVTHISPLTGLFYPLLAYLID